MQEVTEHEPYRLSFNPTDNSGGGGGRGHGNTNSNGFVVQGGPWEQRAPNTASVTEFPTFGGRRGAEEPVAAPPTGVWGPRR